MPPGPAYKLVEGQRFWPHYHETVRAVQIVRVESLCPDDPDVLANPHWHFGARLHLLDPQGAAVGKGMRGYGTLIVSEEWLEAKVPHEGGYLLQYEGGHLDTCPRAYFEANFARTEKP